MPVGAPLGNQNANRGTRWRDAIGRAIECWPEECKTGQNELMNGINKAAHVFVNKMILDEDIQFFKEFGDRLDGKSVATVEANIVAHEATLDDLR